MACIDQDTRIYVYVDTSGTVNEAAIAAAVTDLKAQLQAGVYAGVDVDERVFYDSTWTDERWLDRLRAAAASATKVVAMVFINESHAVYHSNTEPRTGEPTAQYTTDYTDFLTAVAGTTDFAALIYAVELDAITYTNFLLHIGDALAGTGGYPAGLADLRIERRVDVDPNQPAGVYLTDLLAFLGELCSGAGDRLRSSVTETTGSLLDAVDVRAVDASISEAYTYAQRLDPATLTGFREALRSRNSATVDVAYYPRPRPNAVMENQYSGVTLLSRLSTYYPQRILDTVDADGLNIVTSGAATATQIISYVLGVWALDTGWLTYEPVPDLRVRMPGLTQPSQYEAGVGVATSFVVAIPQDGTNRKDALTILKELLSPFPGTVVRQNSTGKLEIVPAYGPDADATPFLTLDTRDLESVSIGEADPFGIWNRATFTSRGYEITEETATMQPAWFQIGSELNFGTANWYTPPGDRVNLQPPEDGGTIFQEDNLAAGDLFNAQTPSLWPVSTTALPAGDGISLLDGSSTKMVTAAYSYYEPTLQGSGTADVTLLEDTIPFDGVWRNTIRLDIAGANIYATIACRWNAARSGVEFRLVEPRKFEQNCFIAPCEAYVFEVALNDSSVGYAQTPSRTATFGVVDDPTAPTADDDYLPAAGDGNAIADSQVEYGVLERNINIEGYVFTSTQLYEMARGFVIQNITPKVVRELEVSALSGFRVPFDAIGRLVELPNGDQGRVTGVSYSDDFTALAMRKTATVEVPNPTGAGFIPVDTTYHLHESGDFWHDFTANAAIETEA